MMVESSANLVNTSSCPSRSEFLTNKLHRYGPLTLPRVVHLFTNLH